MISLIIPRKIVCTAEESTIWEVLIEHVWELLKWTFSYCNLANFASWTFINNIGALHDIAIHVASLLVSYFQLWSIAKPTKFMAKSEFSYSLSASWLTHVTCEFWLPTVTPHFDWVFIIAKVIISCRLQSGNTAELYEKCFITTRCTFIVTNETHTHTKKEAGKQTVVRVCLPLFTHADAHTPTHTHTKRGVWAWAIVLAMHKQEDSQTGRRTERQTNGRQAGRHIKWVMKCWQDILLYTHTQTHTHVHKSCECPLRPATVAGAFGVH